MLMRCSGLGRQSENSDRSTCGCRRAIRWSAQCGHLPISAGRAAACPPVVRAILRVRSVLLRMRWVVEDQNGWWSVRTKTSNHNRTLKYGRFWLGHIRQSFVQRQLRKSPLASFRHVAPRKVPSLAQHGAQPKAAGRAQACCETLSGRSARYSVRLQTRIERAGDSQKALQVGDPVIFRAHAEVYALSDALPPDAEHLQG